MAVERSAGHAALMNGIYRRQRVIYDATRKYYLLGRDHLIRELDADPDARILEVACGTGRNLELVSRRYPGRPLFGLDISSEMLVSAEAKLKGRAILAEADATDFDPQALFGVETFDRIILSYSISMIPDWQGALRSAASHLAPEGRLHVVDFGDQGGLPGWFGGLLRSWLAKFHVSPREDLPEVLARIAHETGGEVTHTTLYRRYAQYAVLTAASG
ncbi:MAG: class I SAM-dependent methyltransferase [Pseudomonadota bacterium]